METGNEIPDDIIKAIEEDVHELMLSLTPYESNDDNFKRCVEFTMCHILCEKYPVPSETSVENSLDQFISRYDREGFWEFSKMFETAKQTYLESSFNANKNTNNVKWCVLDCLLQLSKDTFKTNVLETLDERLSVCDEMDLSNDFPEEEKIDWGAYLREGYEKYRFPSDESDEDSSCDWDTPLETVIRKQMPIVEPLYNDLFDQFAQDSADVPDLNTNLRKTFEIEFKAQEWLLNNVQNSWWRGEPHEIDVDYENPTGVFSLRWEKRFPTNDLQFLEEYKFMRALLWVFVADDEDIRNKQIEYLLNKAAVSTLIQSSSRSLVKEILDSASKYFQLRTSYEEMFLNDNVLQIPFSLQVYASVLKEVCDAVSQKLLEEEIIIRKQEKTYTLLSLYENLRPCLNDVNFFHQIHNECTLGNSGEKEPWLSVVRLLSTVLYEVQSSMYVRKRKILLRIFFKTFKVYADMIDDWLTKNKLYDLRNEFFIQIDKNNNASVKFPSFDIHMPSNKVIAPLFIRISKSLLNCSQNVEFLSKVNKMQSMAFEILKHGTLIENIIDEFLQHLHQPEESSVKFWRRRKVRSDSDSMFKNDEMCTTVNSAYLIEAFDDIFVDTNPGKNRPWNRLTKLDNWEQNLKNLDIFPITKALERIICASIERREAVIAEFFKLAIVSDYKFFDHIRTLTGLLLSDMRSFCSKVTANMDRKVWRDGHAVRIFLYDCIQKDKLPFGEFIHFSLDPDCTNPSDRHPSICVSEVVKLIDCIALRYVIRWPMNKIFTNEVIESVYDPLLKIILKINLAMFSVTRLQLKDLPDSKVWRYEQRKVCVLRHWVILLLKKLHSYMMFIVPQCFGDKWIDNFGEIDNFASLQENYLTYLEKVKSECLIEPEMLECFNRALLRVWGVCDDVRDVWMKATLHQLEEQDVSRAIELCVQCTWYLSQVLKKFAVGKSFNPVYHLWMELDDMVKKFESNVPEDVSFKNNQ